MAASLSDLSGDIDKLYQLSLPEFTAGRNALAKRVSAEQGKDAGAEIKALEKPSVSAWVVNQLFWRHRKDFDRMLKAGDDLRASQQKRLAGRDADVNAAIDTRRETLSALMAKARELLAESGSTSDDIRQRVETTLEALSVYGSSDAAPRAGRLTGDVQPPGFAALAALVPAGQLPLATPAGKAKPASETKLTAVPPPAPKKPPVPEPRRVEKARAALKDAEAALDDAREVAEKETAAQAKAQEEWEAAREALDDIQEKLDAAMDRERKAQTQRDERRRAATQATHAVGRAERARDEAERYLQSLGQE